MIDAMILALPIMLLYNLVQVFLETKVLLLMLNGISNPSARESA
jgi:hypothetical protein